MTSPTAVLPWTGEETLISVLYGESGVGKSPVSWTGPKPLLIIDSENGSKFCPLRKVHWNPMQSGPPAYDGTWDVCIVKCLDFPMFLQAYNWLNSGQHHFRSVVVDSLTELQKRCKDSIIGPDDVMNERQWGLLLTKMEQGVRDLRDLTMHPTTPLQCVTLIALSDEKKGKQRPHVQGALGTNLPGLVDVIGYLYADVDETGMPVRRMLIQPTPTHVAKDRTSQLPSGGIFGLWGPIVPGPIDLSYLISLIYA